MGYVPDADSGVARTGDAARALEGRGLRGGRGGL